MKEVHVSTCFTVNSLYQDAHSFSTMTFHDQKMKIYDLSAQYIFPNKLYTTYERIPELVVTAAAARRTIFRR